MLIFNCRITTQASTAATAAAATAAEEGASQGHVEQPAAGTTTVAPAAQILHEAVEAAVPDETGPGEDPKAGRRRRPRGHSGRRERAA